MQLSDIIIRTVLQPGDIAYITWLHGDLYSREYGYSILFETYVAAGLLEFHKQYDETKDCVWIGEHEGKIIASLFMMHREEKAQLRYFLICPGYRGIGLGGRLMQLFKDEMHKKNYRKAFLLTTSELIAAAHLYIRYGFTLSGEKPSLAFGKPVTEQRYELTI